MIVGYFIWLNMRPTRTFFGISALLALTISAVVWKGHTSSEHLFLKGLNEQGKQYKNAFGLALAANKTSVLQVATIIANDPEVRRIFIKANKAIKTTGQHSSEATALRKKLLAYCEPYWTGLAREFDVRHLHFHLAPSGDSFLRIHQPGKFADNLSAIRHTVTYANRTMRPTGGLEIGRASLGIRGIHPVVESKPVSNDKVSVGSIDVGSSAAVTLDHFKSHFGADIAILLDHNLLKKIVWPDFNQAYVERGIIGNYAIEESTRPDLTKLLTEASTLLPSQGTNLISIDGRDYALTRFPLSDFLGSIDKDRSPIGLVTVFADITSHLTELEASLLHNSLNALGIFLVLEVILFLLWSLSHRGLQQLVNSRTNALQQTKVSLEQANRKLEQLANYDALTGIANRRSFNMALDREWAHAIRNNTPISLIMCDVDYFKQYNDIYGHQEGDKCLHQVAQALHKAIRRGTDMLARYGGEEFSALLPNTDYKTAKYLAKKMKDQVAMLKLSHKGSIIGDHVTVSFGVATLLAKPGNNQNLLVKAADEALYHAKSTGRDRVS